jgi:hypothetical protein
MTPWYKSYNVLIKETMMKIAGEDLPVIREFIGSKP